jgi:hypothetical protein
MTIQAQTPAEGILKKNNWGDAMTYQVVCECGQSDHEHMVWIEASDTGVEVQVYVTVKTNFWSRTRWSHMWQLLTQGYVDYEASLIMTEQQAMNYASTLHHAVEDVTKFKASTK